MTLMHVLETDNLPTDWETWRCAASSCPQGLVHLRRRARGEDVWLLYDCPGWVMAATAPVCPACCTTLTREPASAGDPAPLPSIFPKLATTCVTRR